jgi:hypothetical protein
MTRKGPKTVCNGCDELKLDVGYYPLRVKTYRCKTNESHSGSVIGQNEEILCTPDWCPHKSQADSRRMSGVEARAWTRRPGDEF